MTRTTRHGLLALIAILACAASASRARKTAARRQAHQDRGAPESITLKSPFEYAQLVLTGVLENGDRVDVTRMAAFETPAKIVKISPTALVRPRGRRRRRRSRRP